NLLNRIGINVTYRHWLLFESSGMHSDYAHMEPDGQINHFLAYFYTVSQGWLFEARSSDIQHECNDEGTIQDARLSSVAFRLGQQANRSTPAQLANDIR